jgi:hypothetical protein
MAPLFSTSARRARRAHAVVATLTAVALSGCAGTVNVEPAPAATAYACAEISVRLPSTLAELDRRSTNAQATAAWGDPAAVIYRCGVPAPGPSELPCFTVDDIDWLLDESDAPRYVFTTYGRDPAVEVIVDNDAVRGPDALRAISAAVAVTEPVRRCLSATDVFGGGSVAP